MKALKTSKLSVIIWISLICMLACKQAENELYLIPDGFEGAVIILMDEPDGQPKEYNERGYRIYNIPTEGVLKTQFKMEDGWRDVKYKRENGASIRYVSPRDKIWETAKNSKSGYQDSIYVYGGARNEDAWFIVGKISDSDSLYQELNEKWKPYEEVIELREGDSYGDVPNESIFD